LQELLTTAADPQVLTAIKISFKTTLISLLIIVLFGTPVAFILGRGEFKGKKLIETLVDLPTVLPPSVAGVALLLALGRRGLVGGFLADLGLQIPFSQLAVILAQLFIAAPYFIRAAVIGFAAVDDEVLEAGALDGANQLQLFRYIIIPVSQKSIFTGAVMSWARALGEFGATIIFAGNFIGVTQTMPLAIYLGFEMNLELAITLSVILVVISFVTLLIVRFITDQK
jgi:molybdate transport system permease protein